MPRSLVLIVDRELTDKVTPGNRVKVVAILGIHSSSGSGPGGSDNRVNSSYLRVVGIQSEQNRDVGSQVVGFAQPNISADDEERIVKMSKDPQLYQKLT